MQRLESLAQAIDQFSAHPAYHVSGVVAEVAPSQVRVVGLSPFIKLGDCVAFTRHGMSELGEVVRIDAQGMTVKAFDNRNVIGLNDRVYYVGPLHVEPHRRWKGRVINALGIAVDGLGPLPKGERKMCLDALPPPAMRRAKAGMPLKSGVRLIDLFTPICAGQRIGIFAGSGIGKSTLLGMLVKSNAFDTVVIALVGERGREVREFLDEAIGESLSRTIAIVATGDESASVRRLAPKTALCVAEYFRDQGESVLLIVDSITRFAHAARDVALSSGEPPVARGYPPSVFSDLPKLLERAGPGEQGSGSITGFFSVLVDGDDHNDPVADAIRGTLDGHIVLERSIADQGRFPAVNVLRSISRLARNVWTAEQEKLVIKLRGLIARFEDTRDLRLMGGYHEGIDAELDQAVALVPKIYEAMAQTPNSAPSLDVFRELAEVLQPK